MRDVTERNRLQAALHQGQKMEAIGRLAAGVAHDFNNILQSISGSLEMVMDEVPEGPGHELAAIGLRAARRGSTLTHHLLSYARKQMLRPRVVDPGALLADVQRLLTRTLGPSVTLDVRVERNLPQVRVDPGQLETALLNLALNAAHAMPGGGTLTITVGVRRELGTWVEISVTDTGVGMDEATLAQAMEPFFTTKGVKGTGLGLSMVQGFAEQSGGRLHIISRLGEGTVVTLDLPAAAVAIPEQAAATAADPVGECRILLVDDDPDVLEVTGALLSGAGFQVFSFLDGKAALGHLTTLPAGQRIDVVVTDYAMPGMNGAELVTALRKICPALPAVIISGFVEAAEELDPQDGILRVAKPFPRQALVEAVRTVLAGIDVAITKH